jgi:hypothetical protein
MTLFKLSVWYEANFAIQGKDARPGYVHEHVTADQVEIGLGSYLSDMERFGGEGVRRIMLEVERPR